ncbi:MAG: hypothetical protein WBJ48_03105 [Bacteroidales bacterium]|jgi:hypothetical protein|nr:MAG: hypothetical protein BWX63_02181 [Bacteroidetes bacterium ADurb.Bin041]HRS47640.1 hypothetical protein [Tenuifilaceae bacterium]
MDKFANGNVRETIRRALPSLAFAGYIIQSGKGFLAQVGLA